MKRFMHLLMALFIIGNLSAQNNTDSTQIWKKEMVGKLHFTQNQFDNWVQGGEDAWSWLMDVNGKFTKSKEKTTWANQVKLSYGESQIADQESRKSSDEVKFESVLHYKYNFCVSPYVGLSGWSQLARGYVYTDDSRMEVSNIFDPGYLIASVGMGCLPNDQIKTRVGGALKFTVTDKHALLYADDSETSKLEKTKREFGVESVTDASFKLSDNLLVSSKLELFSTLSAINAVDVNWDTQFSSQVSKYISVGLNVRVFYDRDISTKRQLKQILSAGLIYSFF